jgi:hypothetical protein
MPFARWSFNVSAFALVGALAPFVPPRVTPAPITDPCKLMTQDEASSVMGKKVGPGELTHPGPKPRCRFVTSTFQEIFIDVSDPPFVAGLLQDGTVAVSVPGIGDKAAWHHDQYSSALFIVKGSNAVVLGLPSTIATMTPAVEKEAKLIASRM